MSLNFDFNFDKTSDLYYKTFNSLYSNLSFLVYVGKTNWFSNGVKQGNDFLSKSLKDQLPINTLFNISSLVFNIENHKEEVLSTYQCFYHQSTDSLCVIVEESAKYTYFSREIMMNLMEFTQKLGISQIFLFIARKNKEYVKLLQGMMTVGFEQDERIKLTKIQGNVFKVLKMALKQHPDEIQEIEF